MKKFILSTFVIVAFVGYAIAQKIGSTGFNFNEQKIQQPKPTATVIPVVPKPVQVALPPARKSSQYKDGAFIGSVADAYYGNVQVKAVITNGRLTDVVFLDYPQDRDTSRYINSQATPILKTEAIQAQSANVDAVSGASETSRAFIESLSSALAQAAA